MIPAQKMPTIWAEATESIRPDLVNHLPGLTDILVNSDLKLALILTGRSDSRSANEANARNLEMVLMEFLAEKKDGEKTNFAQQKLSKRHQVVIAWLRILYVAIKWFKSHNYDLQTTYLPLTSSPERSPFSQERVEKIATVEFWREALFTGIKAKAHKQDPENAIAMIALSSILCGCLLHQQKVRMLINGLSNPVEVAGSQTFVDFSLPYLGNPDAQLQRWFIDPLTELLLATALLPVGPTNINNTPLISAIQKFLVRHGCTKKACPTSLSNLIDNASIYWESRSTQIDIRFMRQRFLSHSLTHKTWLRINHCDEPPTSNKIALVKSGRIIEEAVSRDDSDADNDADTLADDSVGGIDWYEQIHKAIAVGQVDDVRNKASELLVQHTDDAAATYLGWLQHLLGGRSSSGTGLAVSTVFRQFTLVTPLMISLIGEEDPRQWSLDDLNTVYQSLLVDYEGKQNKSFLAKGLREFQHYLFQGNKDLRIKETRELLGDEAVLSPVEARIITFDEYESAKALLKREVLTKSHERVDAALLLMILIFRLGLRRSEAFKLLLADFHMDGSPVLLVRPHAERRLKTHNSKRSIPLRPFLSYEEMRFLKDFLSRRINQEKADPFSPYVFALHKQKRELISVETTTDLIHECLREVTKDQTLHLHHLRHSFGTWTYLKLRATDHPFLREVFSHLPHTYMYLRKGSRLRIELLGSSIPPVRGYAFAVARLLGHSGPNVSMQHYLHCSDLVVWADTVRDFESSVDKGAVVSTSHLSQSGTYDYLAKDVRLLLDAVRKDHPDRYQVHSATQSLSNQSQLKRPRGRPKKQEISSKTFTLVELKNTWSVLHLAAQSKSESEIVNAVNLTVDCVQSILTLAKANQGKIGLKPIAPNLVACPAWPRIHSDALFFKVIGRLLGRLAVADFALFKRGIEICLSRYNGKQGDVIFRGMKDINEANEYIHFVRKLGYPDCRIRFVVRSSPTGKHCLSDWQKALDLFAANVIFIAPPFANREGYGKWIGIQLVDKKGNGHQKAFALAIYLASLS